MIILGSLESATGLPIDVNWTFFTRCYGWGTTGEYRLKIKNRRFRSNGGPVDPKFQVKGVAPHQSFFFSEN